MSSCLSFCSLASGSKANCYLVQSEKTAVLIDLGLSYKRVNLLLEKNKIDRNKVDSILISHEHSDHIAGIKVWKNNNPKTKIFASNETANHLRGKYDFEVNEFEIFDEFFINDLFIQTFPLSHDGIEPSGYSIRKKNKKISIITDTGVFNDDIFDITHDSDIVVIEANHDIDMLKKGSYPDYLKKRILGKRGHLSNEACSKAILKYLKKEGRAKVFFLAHLSEQNNTPRTAVSHVINNLECHGYYNEENIYIEPLFQGIESRIFEI